MPLLPQERQPGLVEQTAGHGVLDGAIHLGDQVVAVRLGPDLQRLGPPVGGPGGLLDDVDGQHEQLLEALVGGCRHEALTSSFTASFRAARARASQRLLSTRAKTTPSTA